MIMKAGRKDGAMNKDEAAQTAAMHDLAVTLTVDAPVEQVWKAWSDAGYVTRWWGPEGFTCPLAQLDVREGGKSLVCMRAPQEYGGTDFYNTWTYGRIEPHKRIEFVVNFADKDGAKLDPAAMGMPPGVPMDVPHVVTFKDEGDGRTEMQVAEYGYTTAEARDMSEAGLQEALRKMAAIFAQLQPGGRQLAP
jgi:uncharacterized protein YndB with AHSA1/START domain